MNESTSSPVCLVIGANDLTFRQLVRKLGSEADFHQSSEAECHADLIRGNADLAVFLWSATARSSANSIHRHHPQVRIILEQNTSSLCGLGERNGFLSVIEKAQDRSALIDQVREAIADFRIDPEVGGSSDGGIDVQALVGRLASIPMANGGLQSMADYLLDLVLGAMRSGAGGLFLVEPEADDFTLFASRNLPFGANSMRMSRSSKIVRTLSKRSQPTQVSGKQDGALLHDFMKKLSCDLAVPIHMNGELRGCMVLFQGRTIEHLEKCTLASIGYFASEMLRQTYIRVQATERIEQNNRLFTRVTDGLARVKPTGEIEIVHDQNRLIVLRKAESRGHYKRLTSSALKQAINRAQKNNLAPFQLRQPRTGRMINGQIHPLPDGTLVVHLTQAVSLPSAATETVREQLLWRNLLTEAGSISQSSEGEVCGELGDEIRNILSSENEYITVSSLFDKISRLFRKAKVVTQPGSIMGLSISKDTAAAIVAVVLSLDLRQCSGPDPIQITVWVATGSMLRTQIDFSRSQMKWTPIGEKMEALGELGMRLSGGTATLIEAVFGGRWDLSCETFCFDRTQVEAKNRIKGDPVARPFVSQVVNNVLQEASNVVNTR